MADFCTIMTVVPCGGIDWSPPPLLGCGPTEWWGVALAFAVEPPPPWLDVDAADTDVAAGAGADDALLAEGWPEAAPAAELGLDAPPHAASSSISEPSPLAAAHPVLRITSPIRRDGSWSPGPVVPGPGPSRY